MDTKMSILATKTTVATGALVCYIALCRGLRYLRRDRRHASSPYKTREDFKRMTAEDAYQITYYIQALEFPWMTGKALNFALFRTYGIPSISKLLCETQQLGKVEYAGRRYVDTSVLIVEFLSNSPTSERANSAIARMNYLHSRYQKAGKISNDDLLYTLSLFVLEVERWIRMYEWRTLTPLELCGLGTHWKVIGEAMGIDYSCLRHGPSDFKDGLEFFEDLKEWSDNYEHRCMVPNKFNHQLAEETTRILLTDIPGPLKPFGKTVVTSLMDERLRSAMIYDKPSPMYLKAVKFMFGVRNVFLKFLIPPRPYALRYALLSEQPNPKTGRYHVKEYDNEPWYFKSTFFSRNSPTAWFRWAIGEPHPGDGKQYRPEGYHIFEVGPKKLEGHGQEECKETRDRLMASNRGRCPFAV
ncbi:hypothetical protein EJ02DRAFT_438460 [Clathrospora elynae]|uniref:Uncharacterized protein n=1 Tax=Clathrospora elynae TaxID=706981 RepID=A0A6A5SDM3_9PLEO|nr:hypothetical protein EJ02DRAFT_438460 [Clathrospora elynae]